MTIPLFDKIIHINDYHEWRVAITANHGKMVMIMAHDEGVLYYGMAKVGTQFHHIVSAWSVYLNISRYNIDPDRPMNIGSNQTWSFTPRTREQFILALQEHYPDHFEMFLFHPELLP